MKAKSVPDGYHTITPFLFVNGADNLIQFMLRVFHAEEVQRMHREDGSILFAEVRIGDSLVMLTEAPPDRTPMPAMLYIYLDDLDSVYQSGLAAGAISLQAPRDEGYGDRTAGLQDASGNQWWLAQRIEKVI